MLDAKALEALTVDRGGFFTWHDATAAGATDYRIRQLLTDKTWHRLGPGVFVVRAWYDALSVAEGHLVDLRVRLHVLGDGWCAARRSAAVLHGLPLVGKPLRTPQLVCDRPRTPTRGSSRHERFNTLPPEERTELEGLAVTTVARTVVDLAREGSFASGLVVADAALRAGVSFEEILAVAERCRNWPRAPRVRRVLAAADGRAESPLESLSRAGFLLAGLPTPELQVEVWFRGTFVARVDFLWRDRLVIGEADGRKKYEDVQDFYDEKRREERLRDLGFEVVRWDWASAQHPKRGLLESLERAFERGGLNRLAAGVVLVATHAPYAA